MQISAISARWSESAFARFHAAIPPDAGAVWPAARERAATVLKMKRIGHVHGADAGEVFLFRSVCAGGMGSNAAAHRFEKPRRFYLAFTGGAAGTMGETLVAGRSFLRGEI